MQPVPAEILRIHISESDRYEGEPLYEAIVARCRQLKMAGATVFLGLEGYGATAELHTAHLVRSERPVIITVVDTPENIARLVPAVADMIDTGLMAKSAVEMVRVEKTAQTSASSIPRR
jgi:PII-like signaling protein